MTRYVYGFALKPDSAAVMLELPALPEIHERLSRAQLAGMDDVAIHAYILEVVLGALQSRLSRRRDIPQPDDPVLTHADGFIELTVQQAMKLELYKLYRHNSPSISDFSRRVGKNETSVRRLLNLRHQSWATEIESAIEACGKRLVHDWRLEAGREASVRRRNLLALSTP
jgi:hypothetical protein